MASTKQNPARTAAQAANVREFTAADLKAFLPAGFEAADFDVVGGLRPIVSPDILFEGQQPLVGFIVALLDMPPREDKSEWRALLVETTGNVSAKVGEDTVVIPAGKEILLPLSGSLKNNPDLLNAACDGSRVFLGIFSVKGQVDTGKQTPMWDFEVQLHKKTIARTGKYSLHQHNSVGTIAPQIPAGGMTDANGRSAGSMVGGA